MKKFGEDLNINENNENESLKYLKLAENCFEEESFEKAAVLMENIDEDVLLQRVDELLSGSAEDIDLAKEMYIKRNWREKVDEVAKKREERDQESLKTKMVLNKGERGVSFKAENPRFVLQKAEENFSEGYLFDAWWKINHVDQIDMESRKEELLNGSKEEQDLAEKMYVNDEWMKKVKEEWGKTDFFNDRKFREKKWEDTDLAD